MQAKKSLGQHFLKQLDVTRQIVALIDKDERVLEVGAGRGALTRILLEEGFLVEAIEFDKDMIEYLNFHFAGYKKLDVKQANAVTYTLNQKCCVVGNLPYNVSKKIITNFINQANFVKKMIFMVQKEVANSIIAKPNTKDYTKFSIFVQLFCKVSKVLDVEPKAFKPMPKVLSSIVVLKPYDKSLLDIEIDKKFFDFLKIFFSQPSKTIKNNLRKHIPIENLSENLILNARPRQLSVQEIYTFFNYLKEKRWV